MKEFFSESVVTVSTGHITLADNNLLLGGELPFTCYRGEYGFIIPLYKDMSSECLEETFARFREDLAPSALSEQFYNLWRVLHKTRKFHFVNLDVDGPSCDGLPEFDW